MKIRTLLLTTLSILFISCNQSEVYRKFRTLGEDNRWMPSDTKSFEFTIEDDTLLYNLKFLLGHVYDYQFNTVPITFEIQQPDEEKEMITIDLAIKDSKGEQLAECSGDICDLVYKIKEKTKLQKGKYTVTVSHSFGGPYLPNVIGVGMEVEKAEP